MKRDIRGLGFLLLLLAVGILVAAPAFAAGPPKSIKIGITAPLTGPAAEAGVALKQGFLLAADEANAKGGVMVKEFNAKIPVEVLIEDCQSKPEVGVAIAEKLFTRDKVDVLLGDAFHSSVTMAIMELAPKYGKPIMSVEPVSEEIAKKVASNPKRYWNFWKGDWGSTGYADSIFSTYKHLESKGLFKSKTNKIAFIVEDTDYGRSNAETTKGLFAGIGFQSVAMETVPLGYTDFYPQLGKIKSLGPDVLVSVFTPLSSGVALTKQFQEVGVKAYHHAIYYPLRPEFLPQAGKAADGLLWSTLLVDPENNPVHKEFGERIKKKWNVVVKSDHASAYDGLNNMLDSIQRAGSLDPKKVVEALSQLNLKGIMGRYVFEQANHQIKYGEDFVPVPACQIQGGKHRIVWPASLAAGNFQVPAWLK
ncbi:MAG TPA: ABC transporter substrate-binding protein [Thermodesulfobacteriota bacterium]|nr:ABC transporter substrate-binding protein [Thermodesulfobacteriota bacterium]